MSYADIAEISIANCKTQILQWCADMGLPALSWHERSLPMIVVNVTARIWNKCSVMAAALKTMTVEVDATGDALENWSVSVYGPEHAKIKSSAAVEKITLTCESGKGPHTLTEGSMVVTDGRYLYSCTTDASLPGVSYPLTIAYGSPVTVPFVAAQVGAAPGTVSPTSINRLVTTYLGISLSGQARITGGADKESDDALHVRNHTVWATRNPLALTRDAYIYWARTVETVRRVTVIDNNPRGEFTVDVVVAGSLGTATVGDALAVSAVLQRKLLASFFPAISVYPATAVTIAPVGKIYLYPGTNPTLAQQAIDAAFIALTESLPIGGTTFDTLNNQITRAEFEAAILGATIGGERCVKLVELSTPAPNTTIWPTEVVTISAVYSDAALKLIVLTE